MMAATKPTTSDCCRKNQRENNELRDLVISMKLSINILENIKRLSNDYIDKIEHLPIRSKHQDATNLNHLKKFQTSLNNIVKDLRYWNKKYNSKILFDQSCGDDDKITSIFSNGNNPIECELNGSLQSNPPVANPSEGTGLGHNSSGNVGTNAVRVAGNHDHHDHDYGQHDAGDDDDQNNSEHLKSIGRRPMIRLEPSNEKEEECANNPNDDEDEDDVDDDRYLQRNGSNRLKSGDMPLPTELCEMSLKTKSNSTQNGINDSCEMPNLQNNTSSNDHSKGGRETGALMFKKTSTGALTGLHWINMTRGDDENSTNIRLFERLSQTKEKSSSDGGAHSSAHHSKSTTFNSIHSKSTSMDRASMVDSKKPSIIYTRSLNDCTKSNIHGPMFLCNHKGCGFRTNTQQRLSMHKRTHAGEILYQCDVVGCDYISNYKGNVKIHQKHRHRFGSGSTGNKTTGCGEKTSAHNPYSEQEMITISDDDDEGDGDNGAAAVATAVVESSASDPTSIMMDNNPPTNARGRKRSFSYSFLVHTDNTDNENVSMSSADLEPPAKADTAKEQPIKEYRCTHTDDCSYSTKWKQCMQAHEFLHAGIKPYKCDYPGCGYRTNYKGNVNVHKRQHSGTTNLFRCDFSGCGFSTPWKNSFSTHQRNHRNQQRHLQQTSIAVHSVDNNNQQPSIDKSLLAANNASEKPQSSNVNDDPTTSDNLIINDQNEDQEQQIIERILNENQEKLSIKNNRTRIYWPTKTRK